MAHCTNAFGQGWRHMLSVMFSPFRIGFWLLMTLLTCLSELVNFNPLQFVSEQQLRAFQQDPRIIEPYLVTILIVGIVYFFALLIFTLLSSAARILFYTGVRDASVPILSTLEKHAGRIITYFIWNIIVPLLGFLFIGFFVVLLALLIAIPMGGTDIYSMGIVTIIVMGCFGLGVFVVVMWYLIMMNSFVLPQMVFQEKGIFQAWGGAFGILFSELFEFIGFCMIRFAVWVMVFVLLFIPTVIVGFLFVLIEGALGDSILVKALVTLILTVPLVIILNFFLLPITVFLDAYSLAFLYAITRDERFFPMNETSPDEPVGATRPETHTTDPHPEDKGTRHQPDLTSFQTQAPTTGPIPFKDIPIEAPHKSPTPPLNPHQAPPEKGREDEPKPPPPPHLSE